MIRVNLLESLIVSTRTLRQTGKIDGSGIKSYDASKAGIFLWKHHKGKQWPI